MPWCAECQRLKYRVDIAAGLSVETAAYVLRLADDAPEYSVALMAMRRAKTTLEKCELDYETHASEHASQGCLPAAPVEVPAFWNG